jgi:hypothetical protein
MKQIRTASLQKPQMKEGLKASLARVVETLNDRFRYLTHGGVPILVVGDPQ